MREASSSWSKASGNLVQGLLVLLGSESYQHPPESSPNGDIFGFGDQPVGFLPQGGLPIVLAFIGD